MSPLHLLGSYGKDNSSQILDLFKEFIKDFDLDQKDLKGNSGKLKMQDFYLNSIGKKELNFSIATCISKWQR